MNIGAHLSIGGGFEETFKQLSDLGGKSLQIFSTSPRSWGPAIWSSNAVKEFISVKNKYKIDPVYFHASYLINLADQNYIGENSKKSIIAEMNLASKIGVSGSIVHLGSFKEKKPVNNFEQNRDYTVLLKNIREILEKTPESTNFIIENSGTRKIGLIIEEIAYIVGEIKNDRIKVCLDTCHMHASGIDLRDKVKLTEFLNMFDKTIGLNRLELIHLNDSRDEFASFRDRHDNIGEGKVGIEVFKNLIHESRINKIPFILETPGYDGFGPDKKNFEKVFSLV